MRIRLGGGYSYEGPHKDRSTRMCVGESHCYIIAVVKQLVISLVTDGISDPADLKFTAVMMFKG